MLTNLQRLEMNFSHCGQVSDVRCIGEGLQKLTNLQHLEMNFNGSDQISQMIYKSNHENISYDCGLLRNCVHRKSLLGIKCTNR